MSKNITFSHNDDGLRHSQRKTFYNNSHLKKVLDKTNQVSFFGFSPTQTIVSFLDDESLRRWKEQLLGSVDFDNVGGILWHCHRLEF
ncbi:hypothetical protein G4B88_019209 [Cannabis sativa]|uniref:Uncharacterized protein n=1 Tax=Cannabis sativa TaxID=3483 RepID=A0A7J6HNV2_CANSA|nr:hypothetical protein G4B88_019209 [Cannabis sativa]